MPPSARIEILKRFPKRSYELTPVLWTAMNEIYGGKPIQLGHI